jgi:DNA polymerase-1
MAFLQRVGISRDECYITNAVLCQLPYDKKGLAEAIRCCRPRLLAELETINTGATLAVMGGVARDALYPSEKGGILASRGWRLFDGREAFVMAHPAYTLYNPNDAPMLLKDLKRLKRGRQPQIGPFEIVWDAGRTSSFCIGEGEGYQAYVMDTKELLEEFIASLHRRPMSKRGYIAYDLETDQVDYMRDRILCMSISLEKGTAYIIPDTLLYQDGHEFVTTAWSKQKFEAFWNDQRYRTGSYLKPNWDTVALLRELFSIMGYKWVAHNSKFDMRFLHHLGVENVRCDFDTIVAHYTLDERKGGHGLKPLADDYFDSGDYEAELFQYIAKKSGHYSRIPRHVLYRYNAMDTELTLRLAYTLEAELKEQGLYNRPFLSPMMAAVHMLLDAELYGVGIDWEEFERVDTEELGPELERLKGLLREISGHPELNPLSSVRVNDILYDELYFPIIKVRTRAAGKRLEARSSQRAVLDGWAKMWEKGTLHVSEEAWEFAETLRQYRHIRKMQGSYVRKWPRFRGTDNRVHTSFLLRGTVTGRLSSKDPPLQTIPSKVTDKWGPLISNAHVPKPGWKYLYADYSQAELMAAACMSNDEFMIGTFQKKDVDYHSEVARAAFGENFTRDERQACKRLTFGWLYGGNAYEIALDALQFEGPVAERFAREWDDLFKGVVAWREQQGILMQKQGYVESVFGRRRRYLLLTSRNVGKAKRVAMNAPIQSAVSDLTLISATRLHEIYKGTDYAKVVLLIHDSLIMEVKDEHVEEVKKKMHEVMLETPREVFPQITFQAEVKVGERLGDLT